MSVLSEHYGMLGWAGADPAIEETEAEGDESPRVRGGLRPMSVVLAVVAGFLILLVLNLVAISLHAGDHGDLTMRIARMFMFDEEANLAALFNFALLVGIAVLLAIVGLRARATGDRWWRHWLVLAAIFFYLSYDEAAQMHEALMPIFDRLLPAVGVLYFSWVVPGAAFVLAVGVAYARFVRSLPRRVMLLTIIGAGLYVGGGLGIELVGGDYASQFGMQTRAYLLIATVEESMEMLGLIVFGAGLLQLLAGPEDRRLRLAPEPG